jgi:hypothetical protein
MERFQIIRIKWAIAELEKKFAVTQKQKKSMCLKPRIR